MSDQSSLAAKISGIWWVRVPLLARRLSTKLTHNLLDGFYLNAWPVVSAIAPPLVLLSGLAAGWLEPESRQVFSESLTLMMLMAAIGTMSAQLGMMFLLGYIAGDVFAGSALKDIISSPILYGIPKIIEYAIMAILLIKFPVAIKMLAAEIKLPGIRLKAKFVIAAILHVALTGVLVYLWTQATPVLLRPLFTWRGFDPTVRAMAPLQQHGMVIVVIAVTASAARMVIQGWTAFEANLSSKLDPLQERLLSAPVVQSLTENLNKWFLLIAATIWSCLLLSGVYQSFFDAVVIAGVTFCLLGIRKGVIPLPLGFWARLMERIPLLIRLGIGFFIVHYLSQTLLAGLMGQTNTFRPVLYLTVVSMIIIFLLTPGTAEKPVKEGDEQKT
ncbi:hypothetical protein [Paenibacillus alkalitolerans]|uniref:hypothetical protein n=1 Tax=Paenibacillus alkalitolerans TaxID=2799335 RepID=UPI0018F39043|nr:hypothetical protein [Paenibacillus alkalitolerans]